MKLELIAFTQRGNALAEQLAKTLSDHGHQAAYTRDGLKAEEWAERAFSRSEGLIFVGATGIAVRSIAPHLRHKSTDPAVIVVDEGGQFVIPILSGHLGGANDLAREIATLIGAVPVITTATDVNGVFAVDQWARRQGLMVCNPEQILSVSSRLLAGETVGFFSAWPIDGELPHGLCPVSQEDAQVVLDLHRPEKDALWLCPKGVRVGMGCRRGTPAAALRTLLEEVLAQEDIFEKAVCALCTIDLKKDEEGLLELAGEWNVPLLTYSTQELVQVSGDFTSSPFVEQVTGVDNVCERAALASGGTLLRKKTAKDGVTVALAMEELHLTWKEHL